jgi:hypothetical protein
MLIGKAENLSVEVGVGLGGRPAASGLLDQPASNFRPAIFKRTAEDGCRSAIGRGGKAIGDRPAIDDGAAVLDLDRAHCSFASFFSR